MISDDSCTTERDSGDWSAGVKQEHLTAVKQEPHDVCMMKRSTVLLYDIVCIVNFDKKYSNFI